jgi:hypothetical protein
MRAPAGGRMRPPGPRRMRRGLLCDLGNADPKRDRRRLNEVSERHDQPGTRAFLPLATHVRNRDGVVVDEQRSGLREGEDKPGVATASLVWRFASTNWRAAGA